MKDIIWFIGLPGAGKTTLIEYFLKHFIPKKEVTILRCLDYYLKLKNEDKKHRYHCHPNGKKGFLVTNSYLPNQAITLTLEKTLKTKGIKIIEECRGLDSQKQVDYTVKGLISIIPPEVLQRSIFVYIWSPFKTRLKRNMSRTENEKKVKRKVNLVAMKRYFANDDFKKSKHLLPKPVIFVKNTGDLLALKENAKKITKKISSLSHK